MPAADPTYNTELIQANRLWHVAWVLSEIRNDSAPIGWSRYISDAECLLAAFDMTPKRAPTGNGEAE
jgi:hypothetical protein